MATKTTKRTPKGSNPKEVKDIEETPAQEAPAPEVVKGEPQGEKVEDEIKDVVPQEEKCSNPDYNVPNEVKIDHLNMRDLIAYKEAADAVCKKYENMSMQYDLSIGNNAANKRFNYFNRINERIYEEFEKRLEQLR